MLVHGLTEISRDCIANHPTVQGAQLIGDADRRETSIPDRRIWTVKAELNLISLAVNSGGF